ncbi:MAG: alpha/beta hydrolase [Myxococcales bacterium]|nr:alpha/beta hydrolase [Myxococcales bacterium]
MTSEDASDWGDKTSLGILERLKRATIIEVVYPRERGTIGLRGSAAPLSWTKTTAPTATAGDRSVFELAIADGEMVDVKIVRGNDEWAHGRNYTLHAGDHVLLRPAFERTKCTLLPPVVLDTSPWPLRYQVLLPPSYDEQTSKHYPVLYAQDGQALWSSSSDPFGIWSIDTVIDQLLEIAVVSELIVVGIDTSQARMDRLGPVPDPTYGGGRAAEHLEAMVSVLKPRIDAELRTRSGREDTAVIGSSLGGLFSFYAAWTRPDVFGKAICLSSSFWWANRHMIREARMAPSPRPTIYLDSGVALNPDAPSQDGFQHTRSMQRALLRAGYEGGDDLHRLAFPGQSHSTAAWSARVAIPLQLLFPPPPLTQVPAKSIAP